jgi:lysophospholipase L1-like esterase
MFARVAALLCSVAILATACASTVGPPVTDDAASDPAPTAEPTPTEDSTPTEEPTPTAPVPSPDPTQEATPEPFQPPANVAPIGSPRTFNALVGETVPLAVTAFDSDGEIDRITWSGLPPGVVEGWEGESNWTPSDAGTWSGSYEIVDDDGAATVAEVAFVARYPANADALVAMGDSVASGHGLQELDYLGRDSCWRDWGEAYPRRVLDALTAAGELDPATAELALVACSGHDTDDLFETPVSGGLEGTAPDGADRLTQLDWAVRANPGLVTITIGANDTGFVGPAKLLLPDGTLNRPDIEDRMAVIRSDLRIVLDRLTTSTDAEVFVTNYYNPTASNPQGVSGCREACFAENATEVVTTMNAALAEVVAEFSQRVQLVDIYTPFLGHGAPNGLGPDVLRAGGFGFIGAVVGGLVGEVHPYCAKGSGDGSSWINSVDCVHPDGQGTQMIADAVVGAILS